MRNRAERSGPRVEPSTGAATRKQVGRARDRVARGSSEAVLELGVQAIVRVVGAERLVGAADEDEPAGLDLPGVGDLPLAGGAEEPAVLGPLAVDHAEQRDVEPLV